MAVEVVGRRTLLAALQAEGPLVVSAIPRLQDAEARDTVGVLSLGVPAAAPLAIGLFRVPTLLIPQRRQIPTTQAVVQAAPLERA